MKRVTVHRALFALGILVAAGLLLFAGLTVVARRQREVLPAPGGPDQVGRRQLDWVDSSRADPFSEQPDQPRRLPVWIWYPAAVPPGSRPAPALPPTWQRAEQRAQGLLGRAENLLFSPLLKRGPPRSHAYQDAPLVSAGRFPVLLLQPGMGQAVPAYTAYAENLASHGYVVVGINEPGSSDLVVYANGDVRPRTAAGSVPDNADQAEVERRMAAIGPVWVADARFVLDELGRLDADPSSPFHGRLDLSRVGLFGHSFGGATALAVCRQDARCGAGADLDGLPFGDTAGQAVPRPFLFLSEAYPQGCAADATCRPLWQAFQQASGPADFVTIDGTRHSNFSDVDLQFSGLGRFLLRRLGVVGSIAPERALAIANDELVAFFDRFLKGSDTPMPQQVQAIPEVQVFSRP